MSVGKDMVHVYRMIWYGSKVDHLLICLAVQKLKTVTMQDPFPSLSVFQYSVLIINRCGLKWAWFYRQKKNPPFPSPRSAPAGGGGGGGGGHLNSYT